MTDSAELLQGTLELLILKALSLEPMHGWGISQRIRRARYYLITPDGRRQLGVEVAAWRRASGAVNAILAFEPRKS